MSRYGFGGHLDYGHVFKLVESIEGDLAANVDLEPIRYHEPHF